MDLTFQQNMNTEQVQQLAMTAEMIQSLKVLRLGNEELLEYIFDALEENPVLDMNQEDLVDRQMVAAVEKENRYDDETSDDYRMSEDGSLDDPDYQEEWYDYYNETMTYGGDDRYTDYSYDSDYRDRYEYESGMEETLTEYLNSQLELTEAPFLIKAVADYIIQTLDGNGYMTLTVSEIAQQLHVGTDTVREALELVQSFEPTGVAASDLAECLMLQLKAMGKWDHVYEEILAKHQENIARNRVQLIARGVKVRVSEILIRLEVLRSLEPKPGNGFADPGKVRYIIPDVKVKKNEDGGYDVFINRASSPRLLIREEYMDMLGQERRGSDVRTFLTGHVSSARWLINALKQRDEKILRVTEEIVRRQRDFFEYGKDALRPLRMEEVAEVLGVHESTVSRAVNDKYLLCSRGVYELRYFFIGGVSKENPDVTPEAVKNSISRMIAAEDPFKPLTDRSIAESLAQTGIHLARRTVAKYREEIGIPSTSVRRKYAVKTKRKK